MHKHDISQQHSTLFVKEQTKSRQRIKELSGKSREFDTICINQSQLKHMHAIRPYCSKERSSSRRDSRNNQSPHKLTKSKSKKIDSGNKKGQEIHHQRQLSEMYTELVNLKSQYKQLKANYNKLLSDKKETQQLVDRQNEFHKQEISSLKSENERQLRNNGILQRQMQRIKKEFVKMIEMQKFKIKKLEQTLQEKDLMIAFLRNQNSQLKKGQNQDNQLSFIQNSLPLLNFEYYKPNLSGLTPIREKSTCKNTNKDILLEQDSLSFSRDKSKETDSIIHSFLSQDQSMHHNFVKKDNILINNSLNQSPIGQSIEVINQTSEKSEKSSNHQTIQPQNGIISQEERGERILKEDTMTLQRREVSRGKMSTRRLQISVNNQNYDSQNFEAQVILQTKKKGASCSKPKKKCTAKKLKQPI